MLFGADTDNSKNVMFVTPIVIAEVFVFTKSFLAFVPPSFASTALLQSSSPRCQPFARTGPPLALTLQIPFSFWSDCAVRRILSPVARVMLSKVAPLLSEDSVNGVVLVALTVLSDRSERPF